MDDEFAGWSTHVRNVTIALVQIASLLVIAEHFHWDIARAIRDQLERYRRWLRQCEFELFYTTVWPGRRSAGDDE